MKRVFTIILMLCVLLTLCACGSTVTENGVGAETTAKANTYAKVTFSDGTTETFEVGEIPAMIRENQYAYNNKYAGNKIEVVTTVTDIESNYGMAGFVPIDFEGGWNCYLREDTPVILDLRNGTLVKVTGTLTTDSWSIQGATVTVME